jgi:hypothetical protein
MATKHSTKKTGIPASKEQRLQLMTMFMRIIYYLVERMLESTAQKLLSIDGERKLRKRVEQLLEIDSNDVWAEEKARLEVFWRVIFGYIINWNDFVLPEKKDGFHHLNILPAGYTYEFLHKGITMFESIYFVFKKRTKYYDDVDNAIKNAKAVQPRPDGNYAWADAGGDEPDTKHLGKSYDDAINAQFPFLGPVEYLLSCALFEFTTGRVYDVKGLTRLSVLDSDGSAMCADWNDDDGSYLSSSFRDGQYSTDGPREAVLTS